MQSARVGIVVLVALAAAAGGLAQPGAGSQSQPRAAVPQQAGGGSQSQPGAAVPHVWSSEVAEALRAYRTGDLESAAELSRATRARAGSGAAAADAALLETLCLLRQIERRDRMEGRARLDQLLLERPALADEPETLLALGLAQLANYETAAALETLDRAAEGFAARKLPERQAEALVALARTWAEHGEWEITPGRFGVARPQGPAAVLAARRRQIELVRERVAALPQPAEALARVDFALARLLLVPARDEAVEMLRRLADTRPLTPATAEAALHLAEYEESAGRGSEARALYERVRKEAPRDLGEIADRRRAALDEPQIELDVPPQAPPGRPLPLSLRVRGLAAVELEVRAVNLEEWLGSGRTRHSEKLLPESGSVQLARRLETTTRDPLAWWDSRQAAPPLELEAEAGAYVVLVRAPGENRAVAVRRLLVISDLRAVCAVGSSRVLVWAERPGGSPAAEGRVRFWMHRSFRPTEVPLTDGSASFALPNEARILQDKGWICAVEVGGQLAICRGRLPSAAGELAPRVALVAGPARLGTAGPVYVGGLLLPGLAAPLELSTGPVEVEVFDPLERRVCRSEFAVQAGGAFGGEVLLPGELEARNLRVVARYRGQVAENILGRLPLALPGGAGRTFRIDFELPDWLPALEDLRGRMAVSYPWGGHPRDLPFDLNFRLVRLPDAAHPAATVSTSGGEGRLSEAGDHLFSYVPEVPTGPLAVHAQGSVTSWDGRRGQGAADVLISPQRPHAWLRPTLDAPRVGDELRFELGWYDPAGLALAELPQIEIRQEGRAVGRVPVWHDAFGPLSPAWRPEVPGEYEGMATLTPFGLEPIELRTTFMVQPAADTPRERAIECTAGFASGGGIGATVTGTCAAPLLLMLAGGDPLAVQYVPELRGTATRQFSYERAPIAGLHVLVYALEEAGPLLLASAPVQPPTPEFELEISPPSDAPVPGRTLDVVVGAPAGAGPPPGGTLLARLVPALSPGCGDPPQGEPRRPEPPQFGNLAVTSPAGPAAACLSVEPTAARDPDPLLAALREGVTLWSTATAWTAPQQRLSVPLPERPGLYKLIVVARSASGALRTAGTILDARRGVELAAMSPERLFVGDRAHLVLRIKSGFAAPATARLHVEPDSGLAVSALRVLGDPTASSRGVEIPLPVDTPLWLRAEIEALQPGPARLAVTADATGASAVAVAECFVEPLPAAAPADAPIRVRRTLALWVPVPGAPEPEHPGHHGKRPHKWVPLDPQQGLTAGQYVRVHEEITSATALENVVWRRTAPGNCDALDADPTNLPLVGQRQPGPPGTVLHRTPVLAAGTHVHEYVLGAVRPGTCLLPPPEVQAGGQRLGVRVEPEDLRIFVVAE